MQGKGFSLSGPDDAIRFQVRRTITALYKGMLVLLEELEAENNEACDKLCEKLPPEYHTYVDLANHFTPEKAERLRSKVLGAGNDTIRLMVEQLEQFDINFRRP